MYAAAAIPPRTSSPATSAAPAAGQQKQKVLERRREFLRSRHYNRRTEQSYCQWVKRSIFFHNVRHPAEMGEGEINAFLTHLAINGKVSAATQNQAVSALLFLRNAFTGWEFWLNRPSQPRVFIRTLCQR